MDTLEIADFLSNVKAKLKSTGQSFDPIWRLRGLMDHTAMLQSKLKSYNWQRENKIVIDLLEDFQQLATKLYERLIELLEENDDADDEQKTLKAHQLVTKLSRELEYIETLTAAVRENDDYYSKSRPDNLSWFDNLVRLAANDLDVDTSGLLVLFNLYQTLGLRSFAYTKEFQILDIPVTVLYTPWEWSVIWHEVAGYKVKEIKKRVPSVFKDTLQKVESKLKPDWTEGYLEEIFEDACSILVFGAEFISIFESILNRTYAQVLLNDERHPPIKIRVNLAKLLLGQNVPEATSDERIVAKEMTQQLSGYLPTQMGKFQEGDPHKIIMKAIEGYKQSPADGEKIFEEARSAFMNTNITIPKLQRTQAQTDLKTRGMALSENAISLNISGTIIELFNKFSTTENKIDGLLELNLSGSDFMSPSEHRDDPSHKNKVEIVFQTNHGDHKWKHKH